jgi:hypothetical protein
VSQSVVNGPSASPSGPGSPSLGMSDIAMLSLFQFSAVDAASAVDYSKDSGFEDGVVDSPPAKVAKLNHAPSPSPSPLRNEKHVRIIDFDASPSKYSVPKAPRSTRRLCMDEPRIDVPTFTNVPVVLVSAPLDVPEAQTNTPNAKVPNFWPSRVFPCWFPCISAFVFHGVFGLASVTCAHSYQPASLYDSVVVVSNPTVLECGPSMLDFFIG